MPPCLFHEKACSPTIVYPQIPCTLCEVSFNIGRIRTPDEPLETAWGISGRKWVNAMADGEGSCSTEETGCFYVLRNCFNVHRGTDAATRSQHGAVFYDLREGEEVAIGQQFPIAEPLRETAGRIGIPKTNLEHVAGVGCCCPTGYSGHRISAMEMRGCDTLQSFLEKSLLGSGACDPVSGDHDFEIESNYFLTGISDGYPDVEAGGSIVSPARRGAAHLDCQDPFSGVSDPAIFPRHAYKCTPIAWRSGDGVSVPPMVLWGLHPGFQTPARKGLI